jgi:phosphoglycerol transferase MdoB-like AlkP superfamily enzyme
MKKVMELLLQFKFVWALFFASAVVIYTIIGMIIGNSSMEFIVVWQLFLLSIVLVFIHYLLFGEFILKKLSLKGKLFIHFPTCYITILIFIVLYGWIDLKISSSLILYSSVYVLFYIGILNSLYLYYKATGEELNSKLAIYKEKRNINKEG